MKSSPKQTDYPIYSEGKLSERKQLQFVRHRQLGDGWQVKRGKAHTYTYQNRFRRFARNELSRTFSSNSQKGHKKSARSTFMLLTLRRVELLAAA